MLPWVADQRSGDAYDLANTNGWLSIGTMLRRQRQQLLGLLSASEEFEAVLFTERFKETPIIRRFQEAVQAFGIRGLGGEETWRLLQDLGVRRAAHSMAEASSAAVAALSAAATRTTHTVSEPGRGERQNWCFFKSSVCLRCSGIQALNAEEPGRLLNSSVVSYREDTAGLVAVKLHHDRVDHRAWDAEFRAMARTAAAARTLLLARRGQQSDTPSAEAAAVELFRSGARVLEPSSPEAETPISPNGATREEEAVVEGTLQLYMTEVPCLSCICAMAQFRKRFPMIRLEVAWDGLPPEEYFARS